MTRGNILKILGICFFTLVTAGLYYQWQWLMTLADLIPVSKGILFAIALILAVVIDLSTPPPAALAPGTTASAEPIWRIVYFVLIIVALLWPFWLGYLNNSIVQGPRLNSPAITLQPTATPVTMGETEALEQ